jgi:hypothetical protein
MTHKHFDISQDFNYNIEGALFITGANTWGTYDILATRINLRLFVCFSVCPYVYVCVCVCVCMYVPYILESNPHPNLICTQFLAIS